jgi:hypothetical protein
VVGACAEQLNPFESARAICDVTRDAKREQHIASRANELGDVLGGSALAISQVRVRHRVQDCRAMFGFQGDCGNYFHFFTVSLTNKTVARARASFKEKSSRLRRSRVRLIFAEFLDRENELPGALK